MPKLPIPVVPTPTSRGLTGLVIALVLAIEAPAGAQDTRRAPPPDFALVGGTVIDGTGSPPRPKCTVVVRGGRIAAVGPDEAVPEGVTTIDVTGRCILPGMIDMHGHLYANDGKTIRNQFVPYALLYLAGGVTTVFSPGDFDPEGTVAFRESVKRGEAIGPRVLTAGPYFDHRPSHLDWIRGVNSADEARQLFDAWKGRIDGVKVYTSIQEPELVAVIGSAHEAGLRVVGHLDSVTATRAIELGIDGLEHGIFTMSELAGPFPGWFPTTPWLAKLAALDVDAPPMKPLIASIVERHVVIDPTTVTFQELLPDFVAVAPDWKRFTAPESVKPIDDLFAMLRQEASKQGPQWLEALHGALRKQNQFVKAVHDRGGIVVTGTDPVGVNLVPGYALHRELRNLVEAGFTPLEAIKAATQDAARALRRDAEIGTIAPGKVADLVVVGGDPAHAIDDVGRTEIVIAGGVRHDPAELRRLAEKGIK